MSPFAVAVVGTGFIGPVHVEALRRSGQSVVGILGSAPARSRAAADSLGIESAYADFDELLRDDRVQSVHITTPNRWHFEQVTRCLRAGKHVMCEKPLATSAAQTAQLVALARQTGLAAGVAYNIRFYPLCHEAAERIRSGRLGAVLHVAGSYVQDWLLKDTDFNWRVDAGEGGELRAVADIGTHWLDLIQFVTGQRITAVCADLQTVHPVRKRPLGNIETFAGKGQPAAGTQPISIATDDCASLLLRFENGAGGCLWVSQVTAGRKNCLRFEIAAAEQALAWDSERPNELWIGRRDEANQVLLRDPALFGPECPRNRQLPGRPQRGFSRHVQAAVSHFLRVPCRRRFFRAAAVSQLCRRPSRSAVVRSGLAQPSAAALGVHRGGNTVKLGFVERHTGRSVARRGDPVRRLGRLRVRRSDVLAAGQGRSALCGRHASRHIGAGRTASGRRARLVRLERRGDQRIGLLSQPALARRGRSQIHPAAFGVRRFAPPPCWACGG